MLTINCTGTPYQIGFSHGAAGKEHIARCIDFYTEHFWERSKQSWPQVRETARSFEANIKTAWPAYDEEIRGIADGSGRDFLDILALNVRTEIAFGMFDDGCTSLSWHAGSRPRLAQNWDWMPEQKPNMIILRIKQGGDVPSIAMVTEAGIIGKIGFNCHGVGVCLNAIKTKGCDTKRLPVHLGLRMVMESRSAAEAVDRLEKMGMAASSHFLIADEKDAVGLEFTATTFARLHMDSRRCVVHTNHLLENHNGIDEPGWLQDSPVRLETMNELVAKLAAKTPDPTQEEFDILWEDEGNYPTGICRSYEGDSGAETLFNIVMDLNKKTAVVKLGRTVAVDEIVQLSCP